MKKLVSRIVCLIIGFILLMPVFYIQHLNNAYTVETYQEALEIEYDFTKPGITLEEVQELNENQAEIEYLENGKTVYSIDGVISSQKICNTEDALSVLYDYRDVLGIRGYEYAVTLEEEDVSNYYIFEQLQDGIKVYSYGYTIVTTKEGQGVRIAGKYLNTYGIQTEPFLSYKECMKMNPAYFKKTRIETVQLVIWEGDNNKSLCWRYEKYDFPHKYGGGRMRVYIDAFTGEISAAFADMVV